MLGIRYLACLLCSAVMSALIKTYSYMVNVYVASVSLLILTVLFCYVLNRFSVSDPQYDFHPNSFLFAYWTHHEPGLHVIKGLLIFSIVYT